MKIDRLSLRLSGISPAEGQRLARLITERLGTCQTGMLRPGRMDKVQVEATAKPGADMDRLAGQIAEQVLRELSRS